MPKEASTRTTRAARGTRSKKDPNMPKRALSAYMFFAIEQRDCIKERNPQAGFGEVGKLLGAEWKKTTEEKKKPYVAKANEDKKRYEREMEEYRAR